MRSHLGSSRVNPYQSEEMSIFTVNTENQTVSRIFSEYISYSYLGENDGNCNGVIEEVKAVYEIMPSHNEGYFDLWMHHQTLETVFECDKEEKTVELEPYTLKIKFLNGFYQIMGQ